MDIDLKNINISDIKDQITKLADKKTLIKIGIIAGAIVLFLIIYYAILNPMANSRKAKLNDMNLKKQETEQFTSDVYSMRAKIKKLKPEYEKYSKLFHSKSEVEGLLQTLSEYAGQNDLVITSIEKKEIKEVLKAQALAKADGKKVSHLHLRWINPFPKDLGENLIKFKNILIPEINYGQLIKIIRAEFLVDAKGLNQVRGKPISSLDIQDAANKLIG